MSVFLSPVGGAGAQFFDNNGNPLTGGKLYTYAAGTTTPAVTYTSSAGNTAHTNPIILDAAGRVPGSSEIWLTDSVAYKFVLKDSNDVLQATWDNITGINSNFVNFTAQEEVQTATAGQTVFTLADITYTPGSNNLQVFVDGVNQIVDDSYLETNSTTVTFVSGLHVGALVKFTTAISNSSGIETDAALVTYDPPFTGSESTTVENKLAEWVSVKDFGAVGDGVADDTAAIQAALDYIDFIGGGTVFVPNGVYNISDEIQIYSNTTFTGQGQSSKLYSTNTTRLNGVAARGTSGTPFVNVHITNLSISSSSVFTSGAPNTSTGQGVTLVCCEQSSVENCFVSGWSDGGVFGDGCRYCYLTNNFVDATAQGIGFIAYSRDCYNNVVSNNVVTNTGTYNAIHLEGAFGGSSYSLYFTTIANNTVRNAYNHGINIENSQYTTCVGNTVFEIGLITTPQLSQAPWGSVGSPAPAYLRAAIFLFGASFSSVSANICNNTSSYAVVVGANSDNSVVVGNTSYDTGGGCLVSDGYGTSATTQVTIGQNNWFNHDVDFQGNVNLLNKTTGLTFANVNPTYLPSDGKTLGWYEQDTFNASAVGSSSAGAATYSVRLGQFTRIGNTVLFSIQIAWTGHTGTGDLQIHGLPYAASGTVTRACSIDNNGIASSGSVISAFIPQGGVSYIALRQTNQTTGGISPVPIQATVAGLTISGQYQV